MLLSGEKSNAPLPKIRNKQGYSSLTLLLNITLEDLAIQEDKKI
jgi:hypothetical protein